MNQSIAIQPVAAGSSTTVETVLRHIDREIGRGNLMPGDAISEPGLIATLGIGRVPIREAIRILAGEGVLELVPNRSARVRSVDATEILEMMDVLTGFTVTAIHLLSAQPLPPLLADEMVAWAAKFQESAKAGWSGNELMQEISLFHFILIKACGNKYLLRLLRKTRLNYYSRYLVGLLGRRAFAETAPSYSRMVAALVRGDPQAAIRILLRSVDRSKSHAKID